MFTRTVAAVFALFLCCCVAHSHGSGHVTTFDPNLFPVAQANGTIKNFITDYSATCNGTANDDTARTSWLTFAQAQTVQVVLYIPPGSRCHFASGGGLLGGVKNGVVWGYGASFDSAFMGADNATFDDNLHSSRVQTVSAGATTVSLVAPGEYTRYNVGDWILVSGVSLQDAGSPPNFQFFEFRLVTAISTNCPSPCSSSTVTINEPLANSYKSTWPLTSAGSVSQPDLGGPATIYDLNQQWNGFFSYYGLTNSLNPGQTIMRGRSVLMTDFYTNPNGDGTSISVAGSITMSGAVVGAIEVDKSVSNWYCLRCKFRQITGQSASTTNTTFVSSQIGLTSGTGLLNGSMFNGTFINSNIVIGKLGPNTYGHGGALVLDGSNVNTSFGTGIIPPDASSSVGSAVFLRFSEATFSAGTFTVLKAAGEPTVSDFYRTFIPGFEYYFGDNDGSNNASPTTTFTVSDISEDATHLFATISNCSWGSCSGALPTPTCNGHACFVYGAYPATTIKQINGTGTNLSGYASP